MLTPHGKKEAARMEGSREVKQGTICSLEELKERALALVTDARASELVITITQEANHSHVFGKFDDYIQIRESDELLKLIQARPDPQPATEEELLSK
jgi:hypothetical protein